MMAKPGPSSSETPMQQRPQPVTLTENMLAELAASVPSVGTRQRVYLQPGALHASAEATQVTTILGSCVAVCLWDSKLHTGGMNHFLLPVGRLGEGTSMR